MKIKNILLLLLTFTLASCDKYLDVSPDARTSLDGVSKVKELLVTAYPTANYITFAEGASDNVIDKIDGVKYSISVPPFLFEDYGNVDGGEGTDTPIYYWYNCYSAIAAANHALAAIANVSDQKAYLPYKGEALLARAYAHFMLVTFFSKAYVAGQANSSPGIPYLDAPETQMQPKYDRRTVDYVYQMIENDINEGIPLIKNTVYTVPKYHFTTQAAHAFASRFFLFKKNYAKVIEHANQVVAGGNFSNSLRPWITEYNALSTNATKTRYGLPTEAANLLVSNSSTRWGYENANYRYGLSTELNQQLMIKVNVTGASWGQRTATGRHNKFTSDDPNLPLLSAEEVLFNRAEAYAYTGQNEKALADLNLYASKRITGYNATTNEITLSKIRDFYATTDDQTGLVNTVLDFKRSEFVQEGIRWFDILRHGITVRHDVLDDAGTYVRTINVDKNDLRRVFQIPTEAKLAGIELNPR
ncbi:RagB/SusD family nutrient uptake outer membrane protein [Pedobacter agri]|uniref:RagB/SusD family nutrient uptake outer membrane protein n=1 Tax=Pedobacter agri TaxID=454586 RepID=UPI00292E7193|nr:RagB/SusD family nutrient uptake outer membrane protein [Pedobacter agri]